MIVKWYRIRGNLASNIVKARKARREILPRQLTLPRQSEIPLRGAKLTACAVSEIAAFGSSDGVPQPRRAAKFVHYRRCGGNFAILAEDNFAHGASHEFRSSGARISRASDRRHTVSSLNGSPSHNLLDILGGGAYE